MRALGESNMKWIGFCGLLVAAHVSAQTVQLPEPIPVDADGTVHVPATTVPPSEFLSPQAKAYLAEHLKNVTRPEMLRQENGIPPLLAGYLTRQRELFSVDRQEGRFGGVHAYVYTPREGISARNRKRVLIDLHGGGFAGCWPGCAELESIPIAALGRIKVISLDYREAPQYRFPAASEDVAAAYRELLKTYRAADIGIYGCSAGGMLTGMSVAWFQQHDLPRPGAIGMFCAGATVARVGFGGDANYTAMALGEARSAPPPAAQSAPARSQLEYLAGADLEDPLVSPAASATVLAKFPPTLIITGSRAFEMSSAIYTPVSYTHLDVYKRQIWRGRIWRIRWCHRRPRRRCWPNFRRR